MEMRRLGEVDVPVVGLGCNNFGSRLDARETREVVAACLDVGITLFDTADIYGRGRSEEYLGRALGSRRENAVIATKFGMDFTGDPPGSGGSAEWIATAVEGSLRRLDTDYIDLYQLHQPDEATPIDETLEALDRLVEAGKVRMIGCSNFSARRIDDSVAAAAEAGTVSWVSVQNQFSLLHRAPEEAVLAACKRHGLGFLPYFPLHAGLLTGKYVRDEPLPAGSRLAEYPAGRLDRFYTPEAIDTVERLRSFCRGRGRTMLELAVSWLLSRDPVVSVIAGASKPEQVRANAAAWAWNLTPQDLAEIDGLVGD